MEPRQERGLVIAATMRIQHLSLGHGYGVPSQSMGGVEYRVDLNRKRCTCPDFEERRLPCKHMFAVEFFMQRETETTPQGETITETRGVRITYPQKWAAYNAAATTEKEHFCRLLHDLCATIPTPPQERGRPRLQLSDGLFAAALKVYTTVSGRRCMTDVRGVQEKGLITHAPHYNSIYNVIGSEPVTPILYDLIETTAAPLAAVESQFAVDATGIGVGQFFRYYSVRYERQRTKQDWVKAHAIVGTKTNIVAAVRITERHVNDCPLLPELVQAAAKNFTIKEVSADKGYLSRANQEAIVAMGAQPYIAFKANSGPYIKAPLWSQLWHYFNLHRDEFLAHYHRRSNVETTFSMIKKVFGDSVRSKTPTARVNEVLLKILCHNIRVLVHEIHELEIDPTFGRSAAA